MAEYEDPDEIIRTFPAVELGLIRALKALFRPEPPSLTSTEREDCYHAGEQAVISTVEDIRKEQLEAARERGSFQKAHQVGREDGGAVPD